MNARSLPDELVREILAPLILVSESKFFDVDDVSPFAIPSPSCSAYLVVCKHWMRVATPLLYDCIIVRSKAQAQAIEKVLKQNPSFGPLVKKLRVEGGFGMHMYNIIKACPAISDLTLSLHIWSPDTVSGLVRGLPTLNIQRLSIIAGIACSIPLNKAAQSLAGALAGCIEESWKSMHTCRCSWKWDFDIDERAGGLKSALCSAPALRSLYVRFSPVGDHKIFLPLLPIKTLRNIFISNTGFLHYRNARERNSIEAAMITSCTTAFEGRFVVRSDKPASQSKPKLAPTMITPTVVSFVPLQGLPDDVQDTIWGRIIFFAAEADYVYKDKELIPGSLPRTVVPMGKIMGVGLAPMRLRIALVSRRFYRLTYPHLHYDIHLTAASQVHLFAEILLENKELGSNIRTLHLSFPARSVTSSPVSEETRSSWSSLTEKLEDALSNQSDAAPITRSREAEATAECAQVAHSLRTTYAHWDERYQTDDGHRHVAQDFNDLHLSLEFIFSQFQQVAAHKLSSLDLDYRLLPEDHLDLSHFTHLTFVGLHPPFPMRRASPNSSLPPASTPKKQLKRLPVKYLSYENKWSSEHQAIDLPTLGPLGSYRFPSLRMLKVCFPGFLTPDEVWKPEWRSVWVKFLQNHGGKLRTLELNRQCLGLDIFTHCPLLRTLHIGELSLPYNLADYQPSLFFTCPNSHANLRKIKIEHVFVNTARKDYMEKLQRGFEAIDFKDFPALKEIQIPACQWPTSEKEIKKGSNPWVPISEMLLDKFGIRLTNRSGVHWIPRLREVGKGRNNVK